MLARQLLIYVLLTSLTISTTNGRIARPNNFYGSDALLDGYCDEAQYFIDAFTLSSEQLTVEGFASDVTHRLSATNRTGESFSTPCHYG